MEETWNNVLVKKLYYLNYYDHCREVSMIILQNTKKGMFLVTLWNLINANGYFNKLYIHNYSEVIFMELKGVEFLLTYSEYTN